ncbi:hypothetical protein Glove_184g40 [Diversispora epigaea]|uniref:Granulins domain-containing protein n=1 Tax=Diversispora epigaea TaxID=1348612 RepID=A0A397ISF8_9GLOM|nr:hypothetical protein Glove_184g40 [Diversispora epigaea]
MKNLVTFVFIVITFINTFDNFSFALSSPANWKRLATTYLGGERLFNATTCDDGYFECSNGGCCPYNTKCVGTKYCRTLTCTSEDVFCSDTTCCSPNQYCVIDGCENYTTSATTGATTTGATTTGATTKTPTSTNSAGRLATLDLVFGFKLMAILTISTISTISWALVYLIL